MHPREVPPARCKPGVSVVGIKCVGDQCGPDSEGKFSLFFPRTFQLTMI